MLGRELELTLDYIGREENASPAVGSSRVSDAEQEQIVTEAIGPLSRADSATKSKSQSTATPRRRGRGKDAARKKKKKAS